MALLRHAPGRLLIIFDTLIGILEILVRNATDAVTTSPHLEEMLGRDLRRFYFPAMVVLILAIGTITTVAQPATPLRDRRPGGQCDLLRLLLHQFRRREATGSPLLTF